MRSSISRRSFLEVASGAAAFAVLPRFACAAPPGLNESTPEALGLDPEKFAEIERDLRGAVEARGVPAADMLIARRGAVALRVTLGQAAVKPEPRALPLAPLWDLASLTKVIATTTAIAQLYEAGQLDLDAPVSTYLPAFANAEGDRTSVTTRHLLTHTAGIPAGGVYGGKKVTVAEVVEDIVRSRRVGAPGEVFLYSDYSAIALQAVAEAVSGVRLDAWCREHVFAPLGMADTMFTPDREAAARCTATAPEDTEELRGVVHDPTARSLGGVSGNAGLFSNAPDLARFCQMMLNEGEFGGARILKPETIRTFTEAQKLASGKRTLGWDRDSPYSLRGNLPLGSYGHSGFTGTSLWIDPTTQTFIILLTNAVHTRSSGEVIALRRRISSLVAAAVLREPE